jgi:serine/threonine protein kinase
MRRWFPKEQPRGVAARDLNLGAVLDGRYRIDIVSPSAGWGSTYLATHLGGGQFVKIVEVPAAVANTLHRAVLVSHPALATLLELLPAPGGHFLAVFDLVQGPTLEEELERRGRLPSKQAVACALAVADALTTLHGRRAVHGLLRPASIVLETPERATAVLSFAPLLGGTNPYRRPESSGTSLSAADDVWALGATLHHALTGQPPPPKGYRGAADVRAAGVGRHELAELLAACLHARPANRISLIRPVYEFLAGEVPNLAASLRPPPPGPRSSSPRPLEVPRARSSGLRPSLWAVGVLVAAFAGLGVWRLSSQNVGRASSASPPVAVEPAVTRMPMLSAAASPAAAPSSSSSSSSAELGATAANGPRSVEDTASCVIRQFPPETFLETPKMDWLCSTSDPRKGVERMRVALVRGAGPNRLTDAMNQWSRLRWFGMAGFQVVRLACCRDTSAIELPEPPGCGPAAPVVERLADAIHEHLPMEEALGEYRKHMTCQSFHGRMAKFGVDTQFGGGQEEAFLALLAGRQAH